MDNKISQAARHHGIELALCSKPLRQGYVWEAIFGSVFMASDKCVHRELCVCEWNTEELGIAVSFAHSDVDVLQLFQKRRPSFPGA